MKSSSPYSIVHYNWVKLFILHVFTCIADLTLEFDELNVLTTNREYILSTLQLEDIDIEFSDKASEKTQEECKPGTPFIVFRVDPSIDLTFVNDQPHTGK